MKGYKPKLTPSGGHRGIVELRLGGIETLETGTRRRAWNVLKLDAAGPKGKNGWTVSSATKTETPSLVCPVVTHRGGERVEVVVDIFNALVVGLKVG
jgi:hypothetical protein